MANEEIQERIDAALEADVPKIYFNTSIHSFNPSDVLMVLERNGRPVAVLNTSWAQAKSMVESLNKLIKNVEDRLGEPIKSSGEIDRSLKSEESKPDTKKKRKIRKTKKQAL